VSDGPDTESGGQQERGRSGASVGHLDLVRAALVTGAFVVVLLLVLAKGTFPGGTGASQGGASTSTSTSTTTPAPTTTVAKGQVKVQVANGSSTAGIATKVTQQLQTQGWNTLPPVNATSQVPSSKVYYAQGREAAAREVAAELRLPASSLAPLTAAVPVAGATGDDVVVVVGPDLAS
jgi:LytR cell envelope-related transcriptional attenuator